MPLPDFEDFNPDYDLLGIANWLIRTADYLDNALKNHNEKEAFCKYIRNTAIDISSLHGKYYGAIAAIESVRNKIPDATSRIYNLELEYKFIKADIIIQICKRYVDAAVMLQDIQHGPGRPKKRLPNYDEFAKITNSEQLMKKIQYAWEFAIAVRLRENKRKTGKFSGMRKMLDDEVAAGHLDEVGDTEQRIRRLARQMEKDSAIYLSPGLQAAYDMAVHLFSRINDEVTSGNLGQADP